METRETPQRSRTFNGPSDLDSEDVVIQEVKRAIREIEFGSVLLKIHQGEVVGIETSTKVRLKGGQQAS